MNNRIVKSVQGSFHQGNLKFGYSAGIQCSCNSLFSVYWSKVRKLNIWKQTDLDYILEKGNDIFKAQNKHRMLYVDEIPDSFLIEGREIQIEKLRIVDGEFIPSNVDNKFVNFVDLDYVQESNSTGIVMFMGRPYEMCMSINFDSTENLFLFDSHSRGQLGEHIPEGLIPSILTVVYFFYSH